MPHYARTYGTSQQLDNWNSAWQYPTAPPLDNFGVPVPNQMRTFGLEEFNFNPFLLNEKIAYVPCYGTHRFYPRPFEQELRLIFKINNICYLHYATLYNVYSLQDNEIPTLRAILQPEMANIYLRQESALFFGADYPSFQNTIDNMYNSPFIASNQDNSSFLVNVKYERIDILKKPVYCKPPNHYASQWYINVEYPANCHK
jgi:hypothetical protein